MLASSYFPSSLTNEILQDVVSEWTSLSALNPELLTAREQDEREKIVDKYLTVSMKVGKGVDMLQWKIVRALNVLHSDVHST
jgi:hypothetical protein